jgi:hypothetical protein
MFKVPKFDETGVIDYASALRYFECMRPWRGETATTDERPLEHRRARHMGVTYAHDRSIRFRLHSTNVVTYFPDNTLLLNVYPSLTTDSFVNTLIDWSIRAHFQSGYVKVDDLAYRAVDTVTIHPDRSVEPSCGWSKYEVNRKALNAAIREHAPDLAEATAWLRAAEAIGAIPLDTYDHTLFSQAYPLSLRLERLEDRENWPCLTEDALANIRKDLTKKYALFPTEPVMGIPTFEIESYRQAWRKWGERH